MKRIFTTKLLYIVASFLFATLLFFNANSTNLRNTQSNFVTTPEMFNATLHDLPIQLVFDQEKYFVSGFGNTVTVYLSSYNRIRLDGETNESTRSFTVQADLSGREAGTYDVPLRFVGLNSAIHGEMEPPRITVTIEPRVSVTKEVQVSYTEDNIATGFQVTHEEVNPIEVQVISGQSIINEIASVEAVVPLDMVISHNYSASLPLRALDANGQELTVEFSQPNVDVSIEVEAPSKVVGIVPVITGNMPANVLQYHFDLNYHQVTIKGPPEELARLDAIHLPINIEGITSRTTRKIPISTGLFTANPEEVEVTIIPVLREGTNGTNGNNSSEDDR